MGLVQRASTYRFFSQKRNGKKGRRRVVRDNVGLTDLLFFSSFVSLIFVTNQFLVSF